MCWRNLWVLGLAIVLMAGCKRRDEAMTPLPFQPYTVQDSSQIKAYPDGLKLYVVTPGPGDYPQNGDNVILHYYGMLDDGTVFDDSYSRGEALQFTIGSGRVIAGIESAARKLRFGSKAIAYIPPALGYGNGADGKLPPKIPANAALTFHMEMVGSF